MKLEYLIWLLMMLLGFAGAWLLGPRFGTSGYLLGFLAGAFALPVIIAIWLKVLDWRR